MARELRDGTVTDDVRLDRIPFHDPRSRNFRAVDQLPAEAVARGPRSYTWRIAHWTEGAHAPIGMLLNQGSDGACVGFAYTYEMMARPLEIRVADNAASAGRFAKRGIYWPAQRDDEWAGGSYPGASPSMDGTSMNAGAKILRARGLVGGWAWAFGEEEAFLVLGYNGPIVLGIPWMEGMDNPNRHGFVEPTGRLLGYHAICAFRARARNSRRSEEWWELINSWGAWGAARDGVVKIAREHMAWLLAKDRWGEAVILTDRGRGSLLVDDEGRFPVAS